MPGLTQDDFCKALDSFDAKGKPIYTKQFLQAAAEQATRDEDEIERRRRLSAPSPEQLARRFDL